MARVSAIPIIPLTTEYFIQSICVIAYCLHVMIMSI